MSVTREESALPSPAEISSLPPNDPPQKRHVFLYVAFLGSAVLHLVLLAVLNTPSSDGPSQPENVRLEVTLNIAAPIPQAAPSVDPGRPAVAPLLPSPPAPVQSIDDLDAAAPITDSDVPPPAKPVSEMIRAFIASTASSSWKSHHEPCDLSDRATPIRRCKDNSPHTGTTGDSPFEAAFNTAFRPPSEYFNDTATIDRLMGKQAALTHLIAAGEPISADLVKMRQEVRDEINFIDRKYAEGNLFKVIGISAKVTKALWENARKD
jgi:hypothetical protein